jgi:hypothetical protein
MIGIEEVMMMVGIEEVMMIGIDGVLIEARARDRRRA